MTVCPFVHYVACPSSIYGLCFTSYKIYYKYFTILANIIYIIYQNHIIKQVVNSSITIRLLYLLQFVTTCVCYVII